MNPYETLGLQPNASKEDVKQAYRRLAREYHPDRNPGDEAAVDKFKQVQAAYDTIEGGQPNGQSWQGAGFTDIFSTFFNMGEDVFQQRRRGRDIHTEHTISFIDAAKGCVANVHFAKPYDCTDCAGLGAKTEDIVQCEVCGGHGQVNYRQGPMSVHTTCSRCHGHGKINVKNCTTCAGSGTIMKETNLEVTIPAGIRNGDRIRLENQGGEINGGRSGHAYLTVNVRSHPLWSRSGNDCVIVVPLAYYDAVLGTDIELPTLQGMKNLTIKPGTRHGDTYRLEGEGLTDPVHGKKGDFVASIIIDTTPPADPKELLEIAKKSAVPESIKEFQKRVESRNLH